MLSEAEASGDKACLVCTIINKDAERSRSIRRDKACLVCTIISYQLSIINYQLSIINYQCSLFIVI